MAKSKTAAISIGASQDIPLNQLKLSDDNVRKIYSNDAVADLAADIRINNLIHGLSVRALAEPDGNITHEVQGGGRRFRALQLLVKQKALASDAPIPCIVNETAIAAQISLAENVTREALHPLDEYRAFAAMVSKGKTEDEIAQANRVSVHIVRQRLRMGTASPVIQKAFEDGKMTLQTLMAFCVTDNHARQELVWKDAKAWSYVDARSIKQKLMEDSVSANDKRVRFVGLDVYVKAGGVVDKDLFDLDHEGYLRDVDLLNQLVQAKLDREAQKLTAKGWKWAKTGVSIPYADTCDLEQLSADNEELTEEQEQQLEALEAERYELQDIDDDKRSKKQTKRLEAVEAEIEAIENREPVFSAEDMARAGVTIEIDHNGKPVIEYGYVKTEDTPTVEGQGENDASIDANTASTESEDDGIAKLPDSLVTSLTIQRTACFQAALSANPEIAFLATLHALALSAFYHYGSSSCLQITGSTSFPKDDDSLKDFAPMKAMADQRKAWTAQLPRESAKLWDALKVMPREEQMQLLAFLAASTINVVVQKHEARHGQVQHSHILADALGYDIRKDWAPTSENFFGRVPKATILASVTEARDERTAERMSHLKKIPMAAEAQRLTEGTGWIPEPMRAEQPRPLEAEDDIDDTEADLPDFLQADGAADEATATA
jgi:ParB family chromosome partitioning protein